MTTNDPKLDSISAFFEAYGAGDRAGIAAALADDFEWSIPHPLAGTKKGIDEVLAFFDQLGTAGFDAETWFLEASDERLRRRHPPRLLHPR